MLHQRHHAGRTRCAGHVLFCHDLPRPKGAAADVALTYPALADRLARESGWRVVTGSAAGRG